MGKKKSETTPLTILLTAAQYNALDKKAKADERSISWLVRKAINEYYAKEVNAEESISNTDSNSTKDV